MNHQQLQSSIKSPNLTDTDATAVHANNWCSPVLMMRVLLDPVNDAAQTPMPIPEVQSTGEQNIHLQCTTTCVTPSYPPQISSSQMLGTMIQLPLRKTSQQHHWITKCGLKIQFQTDTCASMKHLMSLITSVCTLVHTETLPSGWTCYNQHYKMK